MYTFKYDNNVDRLGLMKHNPEAIPSTEDQKAFVQRSMAEFEIDFEPQEPNKVYHVVSNQWYTNWKEYVNFDPPKPV